MKVLNPSTGEVLADVSEAGAHDVEKALALGRGAFDRGPWPRLSLSERKSILLKISQGILDNAAELGRLESLNTGKPIKEATFMDVPSAAKTFEHFANNLETYLQGEEISVGKEARATLIREPLGVAVLIVPWNYPLIIACWKLAQALAAGNTAIVKPSSLTPMTALELGKIIHAAGVPKGVAQIVVGRGEVVGKALCSDQRVDLVSFTGSNEVGKKIIGYAAEYAKKLLMELGGKSAGIVRKDADLEVSVNGSLCSIFLNQGQMCTSMSRIFVEDDIYDEFLTEFVRRAKKIKLGPGLDHEAQMGPLISAGQREKVLDLIEQAKKEGARLLCGGIIPENPALKAGNFIEPAVFVDTTPSMAIFEEEVFGPVACISKFSTEDEAVRLANTSDFGLAAVIWSSDERAAIALAHRLDAGTVWINTYGMFYNELPYGGFKQSGFGKELGKAGFLEYTRLKNIVQDTSIGGKPLVNYWYGF